MSKREKDYHTDIRTIDPTPLKTPLIAEQLTVKTYEGFVSEIDKAKKRESDDNGSDDPSGYINPVLLK